jgi:hypothetical protein
MKRAHVMIGIALLAAAATATYAYYSPHLAVRSLRTALVAGESDVAGKYIDYPAVRESLKGQVNAQMMTAMDKPEMRDNPFAALGMALVTSLVDRMVDAMVSPEGLRNLVEKGRADAKLKGRDPEKSEMPSFTSEYKAWDIWTMSPERENAVTLVFHRTGIIGGWKLRSVRIPDISQAGLTKSSASSTSQTTADSMYCSREADRLERAGNDWAVSYANCQKLKER